MKKPVKTAKDLSPAPIMNKVKHAFSPGSTAGTLRDRGAVIAERLKKSGA